MTKRVCSVEGCEKRARRERGRGFCSMHNERWRKFGTVELPNKRSPIERFMAKVDDSKGPDSCHLWIGAVNRLGYGRFNPGGGPVLASRWLLGYLRGKELVAGEEACHHCDNPRCVNQRHLYIGSRSSNMKDAVSRNRMHGSPKLTHAQVGEIRSLYAGGQLTQRGLAKQFGVGQTEIFRIVHRERWTS